MILAYESRLTFLLQSIDLYSDIICPELVLRYSFDWAEPYTIISLPSTSVAASSSSSSLNVVSKPIFSAKSSEMGVEMLTSSACSVQVNTQHGFHGQYAYIAIVLVYVAPSASTKRLSDCSNQPNRPEYKWVDNMVASDFLQQTQRWSVKMQYCRLGNIINNSQYDTNTAYHVWQDSSKLYSSLNCTSQELISINY